MSTAAVTPRNPNKVDTPVTAAAPATAPAAAPAPAPAAPATAPQPGFQQPALALNRGPASALNLPASPTATAPAPVPAYNEAFGNQSYVKAPNNGKMVDLAKAAIAKDPALKDTPFGKSIEAGNFGKEEVKQLQQYLQGKGYNVGNTGVDGKYGPNTHQAMKDFLEGKPPAAPTQNPTPGSTDQQTPTTSGPNQVAPVTDGKTEPKTAVFDMRTGTVTLPDGTKLEAHSGRGVHRDKASSAHVKNAGPTPPGVYKLTMRESRFHGVEALRLTPINGTNAQGRDGLLAHPYMMRNRGDSHGCVVFANYPAFLNAWKSGQINQIRVVG